MDLFNGSCRYMDLILDLQLSILLFQDVEDIFHMGHHLEGKTLFNATLSNILVISWHADLLVEETRVTGENHDKTL